MKISVGDIIDGKYRIEKYIGSGTTCHVYKAVHIPSKTVIALKIIKGEIFTPTIGNGRSADKRLDKEIEFLQQLKDHPNIIPIKDKGIHNGVKFLVMDFMEFTLEEYFDEKKRYLTISEIFPLMERIASAIDYAHKEIVDTPKKTIIHRDIKPANILLRWESSILKPYIADFDVAVLSENVNNASVIATKVGTFLYKAPETFKGIYTPASDIYSLGVILYELLDGFPPFSGNSEESFINIHSGQDIPYSKVIEQKAGSGVFKCIEKCMAKDPSKRYQTAGEFIDAVYDSYQVWLEKTSTFHHAKVANRIQWLLLICTIFFGLFSIFAVLRNADASSKGNDKSTEIAESVPVERRNTLVAENPTQTLTITVTPSSTNTPTETQTPTITSTSTEAPTPTVTPCAVRSEWTGTYNVQGGDTISSIADQYGLTMFTLADGNCIRDRMDQIILGEALRVPYRAPANTPTSRPASTLPVSNTIGVGSGGGNNIGGDSGGNVNVVVQPATLAPTPNPTATTIPPIVQNIQVLRGNDLVATWQTGSSGNSLSVAHAQNLVLEAIAPDSRVKSVCFSYNGGNSRCENNAPYTHLENATQQTFSVGSHSFSITAWSDFNGGGSALGRYSISFNVVP